MTALRYASSFVSTVLTNSLSSVTPGSTGTIQVGSVAGLPAQYPFRLILDWQTATQEVVRVTQAPTGTGPYTFANCVRGDDGSAAPAHTAGVGLVVHGTSASDFSNRVQVYSVLTYGADNTGTSESTTAFANCISDIAAAGGGEMRIPAGNYKVNTAQLPVCTGLRIVGDGKDCTTVTCVFSGAGGYLFNLDPPGYSSTVHVEGLEITGVTFDVTNADIFWGANLVRAKIAGNQLIQRSAGNAIMNIQATTGTNGAGYLAECYFANKEMIYGAPRTIEAWHLDWSATSLRGNDNTWARGHGKIWPTLGGDTSMYWMKVIGDSSGQTGSRHNTVDGLIFELSGVANAGACGGLIHLLNTTNWLIKNVSSEDLSTGTVGNPLILLNTSGSPGGCSAIQVENYSRRGGSNVSNTNPDIKIDSNCSQIKIDSPSQTSGGAALNVDLGTCNGGVTRSGPWQSTAVIQNPPTSNYHAPPAAPASIQPSDPTGTTSASAVMMGLGATCTFTPSGTGQVLVTATGVFRDSGTTGAGTIGGRYGTGTAPANGAAVSGTRFGAAADFSVAPTGTASGIPFCLQQVLSLTPGTTYWFDLPTASNGTATANPRNVTMSFTEQP